MNNFSIDEAIMRSIVAGDAIPISDNWSLFAYLGDIFYHVSLFQNGIEMKSFSEEELENIVQVTQQWILAKKNTPTLYA
jgi:hypothetical protein